MSPRRDQAPISTTLKSAHLQDLFQVSVFDLSSIVAVLQNDVALVALGPQQREMLKSHTIVGHVLEGAQHVLMVRLRTARH